MADPSTTLDRFCDAYWRRAVIQARNTARRNHDRGVIAYHRRYRITTDVCPFCTPRRAR